MRLRDCTKEGYPIIYGWGINDVDYKVSHYTKIDGKPVREWCPVYADWLKMVERSFCLKYRQRQPTYKGVTVCKQWKYFSVFRDWVLNIQPNKDWENCVLDKDLLIEGNKVYSPENCVYISTLTNTFHNSCTSKRGNHLLGVSKSKGSKKFRAMCSNPFTKKNECLGYYLTELEAHLAWKAKKHEHALKLADLQDDERVAKILRNKFK